MESAEFPAGKPVEIAIFPTKKDLSDICPCSAQSVDPRSHPMKPKSRPTPPGISYAFIVAVEKYFSKVDTPNVLYAEKDALAVKAALLDIGFLNDNIFLYTNAAASKATIEYELHQMGNHLTENDRVIFFFAGHGCHKDGKSYLMAYDSRWGRPEDTAISLAKTYEIFADTQCKQTIFFLDACHSGMKLGETERGYLQNISDEELKSFFENTDFRIVFSSCADTETSLSSHIFQHGTWTYHLLKALRGEIPEVCDKNGRLLSGDLQDYLLVNVKRDVALQTKPRKRQTPRIYGDSTGTFVVADLSILLLRKRAEAQSQLSGVADASFTSFETDSVRNLGGFKRHHRVPDNYSSATQNFILTISSEDLTKEIDKFFEAIQDQEIYGVDDLQYAEPCEGLASISTPDFTFSLSYYQSENEPSEYEITRELTDISGPDILEAEWFNSVFNGLFDKVVFSLDKSIKVLDFAKSIEKVPAFTVKTNPARTRCEIRHRDIQSVIIVTSQKITFKFPIKGSPVLLAQQVQEARTLMITNSIGSDLLPF